MKKPCDDCPLPNISCDDADCLGIKEEQEARERDADREMFGDDADYGIENVGCK
jgi:hypothetical protein